MSIGSTVRKVLGEKLFSVAGRYYRAIFVNLDEVAKAVDPYIPDHGLLLDIGGGDGEPLNHLLQIRPNLKITMIDLSPNIGGAIKDEFLNRVTRLPQTSIRDYINAKRPLPSAIMINDVIHHVPQEHRDEFFKDLKDLVQASENCNTIIKDIEPGAFRSTLSIWADVYISGDKNVKLISRDELKNGLISVFESVRFEETSLFTKDKPNYAIVCYPR